MTEETIFMVAVKITIPAERAKYVDLACAGDAALRERILALLGSHDNADKFLDEGPGEGTQDHVGRESGQARPPEVKSARASDLLAFLAPSSEPGSLGRLDHYEVLEVVGRGGMGVVYKARDTKLQRIVAIKVLAPALAADGTARERFVREARAAAALRDDHVIGIHAVQDTGPCTYLVMEFISGTNLDSKVKKGGPLELKEILRIGMQIASGLAAAHKQGVVHRDIKPANILLENGVQRVKIADFGLARVVNNPNLTQSGMLLGTPLYMAPEQARGESVDHRSDLFSLGSVLYTLCTGTPAFLAGNTMAVLARVCDHTPRPIRDANPDIPDWLVAIVNKLLAKNPAGRFQSAAEVAALLGERLAKVQQPGLPTPMPIDRASVAKRRPLAVALLLIGVVVVVGGVALVASQSLHWGSGGTPNERPPGDSGVPPPPPGVLMVSKDPKHHAKFSTITAALDAVEPGMTIKVLDDAVYDEQVRFDSPARQQGVVLEAVGKAGIRDVETRQVPNKFTVGILGVANVTVRGFHVSGGRDHSLVYITLHCPGVMLDKLTITANEDMSAAVSLINVALRDEDEPVVIRNCTVRGTQWGILLDGRDWAKDSKVGKPLGRIAIRNNQFVRCGQAVFLSGTTYQVHVVGNTILQSRWTAFEMLDLLDGARDIVIANNTLWSNVTALRLWDDALNDQQFAKCKNIRFQNNLVLAPNPDHDLVFMCHNRGDLDNSWPADLAKLSKNPEWRLGYNWRELTPPKNASAIFAWIPEFPKDKLQPKIEVLSRIPGQLDFLQPPKDSPLGKAGVNDGALPAYVGAVPPVGMDEWNWANTWKALTLKAPKQSPAPPDPNVITVSKNPEHKAHYATIKDALAKAKAGKTIRILDDATYDEYLVFESKHQGVALESTGKATICRTDKGLPGNPDAVIWLNNVSDITIRNLRLTNAGASHSLVLITRHCPGVLLEGLQMTGGPHRGSGVEITTREEPHNDKPIVIRNCTIQGLDFGISLSGRSGLPNLADKGLPVGSTRIQNNTLIDCNLGVFMMGEVCQVQVTSNRFVGGKLTAIELHDLLPGARDIWIANNTMVSVLRALRIWHDKKKDGAIPTCKEIRFQNNLVLSPYRAGDMVFFDHIRGQAKNPTEPGDVQALVTSKDWHFGHNWRELVPPTSVDPIGSWIPAHKTDRLLVKSGESFEVLSRDEDDKDFVKPPKNSPLGAGGANEDVLPVYVGAVPPEGMEAWNWDVTWQALVGKTAAKEFDPRVLTVSKNPKHQAQFHTIKDALDQVKPDMTIRILDDAIYDEQVVFDSAVRQSGVVLEAIGKARIRDSEKRKPGSRFVIRIRDVPKVTLRGLQIINGAEPYTHVFITGRCPGAVLQGLEMTSNSGADCAVELADIQLMDKDEPVVIQNCTVRGMDVGVLMEGRHYGKGPDFGDFGRPLGRIVIRNNSFRECGQTFFIAGAVYQVHVVGNKILQSHWAAVELLDLLKGTRDVLIANNTLWSNNNGLRIWDDSVKGHEFLACKNIRFQNNLVLASRAASDLIFMDHRRGTLKVAQPGDLSKLLKNPEWRLSNNWREFVEPNVKSTEASWIPKCYNDHLLADIKVLSRIPGQADFLKPPPLSPLSKYGVNDKVLPPYVGAVPPDGMKEWDWAVTWKALSQSK